jgi:hypothetical protein
MQILTFYISELIFIHDFGEYNVIATLPVSSISRISVSLAYIHSSNQCEVIIVSVSHSSVQQTVSPSCFTIYFNECLVQSVTWSAGHCFSEIWKRDGNETLRLKGWSIYIRNIRRDGLLLCMLSFPGECCTQLRSYRWQLLCSQLCHVIIHM